MTRSQDDIRGTLDDIIEGRIVKRSKHELRWELADLSPDFVDALQKHGYTPMLVRDVNVEPGERAPAFYVDGGMAYFGWVFWEKFSPLKSRKLFGSVVRNEKGDWIIQLSSQRGSVIYVNMALKAEMDIDNPSGL